jgi:hypothetical protein
MLSTSFRAYTDLDSGYLLSKRKNVTLQSSYHKNDDSCSIVHRDVTEDFIKIPITERSNCLMPIRRGTNHDRHANLSVTNWKARINLHKLLNFNAQAAFQYSCLWLNNYAIAMIDSVVMLAQEVK